jgi:ABC-type cobalamin/Fe3+-siderophores transport system ATPase subunit
MGSSTRLLLWLLGWRSRIVYHPFVIRRFYVHNFRCLENFELPIAGQSSVLLIGKNGSGKTTVMRALEILQKIARGTNRVSQFVEPKDFGRGRTEVPMRFEIEVNLDGAGTFAYGIAFTCQNGKEIRVVDEKLTVNGTVVISREPIRSLADAMRPGGLAPGLLDTHLVAFPMFADDRIRPFAQWLSRALLLRPIPSLIRGDYEQKTLEPDPQLADLGAWFAGLLDDTPSAYKAIDSYLKEVMPDLKAIRRRESRNLVVQFSNEQGDVEVPFENLSDGEKCFVIGAFVLAANEEYEHPVFCFWDEPDNYLALSEVQHFVMALRRAFRSRGQFIATSHNPEAIRTFSDENTILLYRNSHLEPTIARPLDKIKINGDLVGALTRGDLEP